MKILKLTITLLLSMLLFNNCSKEDDYNPKSNVSGIDQH